MMKEEWYGLNEISVEKLVALGANKAGFIAVSDIPFDRELRKSCEMNYCGNYGKNWTCPPKLGEIDDLINQAKQYKTALVYQTLSSIEDSFDYEGMVAALKKHIQITDIITEYIRREIDPVFLQLSAGGCPVCEICAAKENLPCRYPDKALASLEAYGIYVSQLAELSGMNYINGKNTVTYFGAYLFK